MPLSKALNTVRKHNLLVGREVGRFSDKPVINNIFQLDMFATLVDRALQARSKYKVFCGICGSCNNDRILIA